MGNGTERRCGTHCPLFGVDFELYQANIASLIGASKNRGENQVALYGVCRIDNATVRHGSRCRFDNQTVILWQDLKNATNFSLDSIE